LEFYQRDAEDVLVLMTALGHEEFTVFGWSDGANIGALMAANSPQRIRRLVIWGGNSYLSAEEIAAFQAMRSISSWSQREADAMRQTYGNSLDALWERYVAGLEELYAAGGDIFRSQLNRIKCPALVLHGEKDPLVPSFHPRIICQGIRGSLLHVFPEGKHRIHAKYAAEFNQLTSAFLAGQ
jgi:valacyclovir hydrolase